jgi:hypothetical protein
MGKGDTYTQGTDRQKHESNDQYCFLHFYHSFDCEG